MWSSGRGRRRTAERAEEGVPLVRLRTSFGAPADGNLERGFLCLDDVRADDGGEVDELSCSPARGPPYRPPASARSRRTGRGRGAVQPASLRAKSPSLEDARAPAHTSQTRAAGPGLRRKHGSFEVRIGSIACARASRLGSKRAAWDEDRVASARTPGRPSARLDMRLRLRAKRPASATSRWSRWSPWEHGRVEAVGHQARGEDVRLALEARRRHA